jgi:hypothetical protein
MSPKHNLKLFAEMVPQSSWENNVRRWLTSSQWKRVRTAIYALYGGRCAVCRDTPPKGRLHCHEVWEYDDARHIQTLVGLVALCSRCHEIKHIKCSEARALAGTLRYEAMVRHFCWVNKCSVEVFYQHRDATFAEWDERSRHAWTVTTALNLEHIAGVPLGPHVPRPAYLYEAKDTHNDASHTTA